MLTDIQYQHINSTLKPFTVAADHFPIKVLATGQVEALSHGLIILWIDKPSSFIRIPIQRHHQVKLTDNKIIIQ